MKTQLNQPEAYLKSVLESVAVLVRSGQFAMTYTLKPENRLVDAVNSAEAAAPEMLSGLDGADDRPGQDDDMEDFMKMDDEDEDDVKMDD